MTDEPAPLHPPPHHIDFVLDASGTVASASPEAGAWLEQPGALQQVHGVRDARSEAASRSSAWWVAAPPMFFRFVPMAGVSGPQLLVTVVPTRPELAEALELLTPVQREVAEYAAAGATNAEIADVLGRSPETVRSHVKEIYRRLSICTRLELQWLLRRPAISYE